MNILENFKLIGVSTLLLVGLVACDKQGPAEQAGQQLDQTVEDAQAKISEAADKVTQEADKASEKLGEQGDKAAVGMNDVEITAKVKAAIFFPFSTPKAKENIRNMTPKIDITIIRSAESVKSFHAKENFERGSPFKARGKSSN